MLENQTEVRDGFPFHDTVKSTNIPVTDDQQIIGSLDTMGYSLEARDKYTRGHSERVACLAFELAGMMGLSDLACYEIFLAGLLHDIGKIGVPDAVLLKQSGLDEKELAVIRQHPEIGYRIVESNKCLHYVLPGVLHHHERWDGQGYPHGISGETIPLMARVLSVVDAFDAMTSSRPYRPGMPVREAFTRISSGAGTHWDQAVVNSFLAWGREQKIRNESQLLPTRILSSGNPLATRLRAVVALAETVE
jgi:HD-GYP domain-containing protein (c-di-GMP phosphodiesterase class II)